METMAEAMTSAIEALALGCNQEVQQGIRT